ncbi:MAG TPA: translocation/assembly module TamB domain-containing protein [Steroidobacteraceae bacterium]|nr:translocation/assembly module TamB domain-containing protein [Steroidobacteraceae bacterium]
MRRLLILFTASFLVLVIVVVPAALIGAAVFTEPGLQFLVRHIPQRFGSGPGAVTVVITGVQGTLARGVHADRVEIDHELVHLKFEGIDGRVALAPLLLQTIRSPDATVHSALIEVKRRTRQVPPSPPVFLPRWLLISAEHTTVDDAVLTVYNGVRLEATHISGAAVLRHRSIRFFQAQGNLGDARVDAIGELLARDPLGIEAEGQIAWAPAGQPAWSVAGSARGDLNALRLSAHALSPFRADFTGQALDLTRRWHIVGDANVGNFDLRAWGISGPLGVMKARLAVTWNAEGFSGRGKVDPTGLRAGAFDAEFAGSFAERVLTAKHMEARHPSGAHAVGSGTFAIVPNGPRLNLSGSWEDFRWPLLGPAPPVRSAAGTFTVEGLLPYKVHVQAAAASAADLSAGALDVTGTLGKDSFAFERAELDVLEGHASVSGAVQWAPHQSWSVAGQLTGVNPAALRADLPGSVNLSLSVSGRGFDPRGDLTVAVGNLSGKLRGARVSGGGSLSRSAGTWSFDRVRAALGGTSLALDGRAGEQLDLRFKLASSDLGLLAPGSHGQLNAAGTLRGTATDPAIVASAHGSALSYQGLGLARLDADIDFDAADRERPTKIDARAQNLSYAGHTIESAAVTVTGPPSDYRVHLDAHAQGLALAAEAAGPYAHGTFQGQLTALSLKGKDALDLALEHPVDLTASAQRARVEWLCLAGTPGSMCADADWSPQHWSATLMSNQLPLSALTAGIRTPAVQYQGTVDLLLRAAGGAQLPVTGTLRAQLTDAVLSHQLLSKKIEHTRIGSGTVTAGATPDELTVAAVLEDGEVGTIRARVDAQRGSARWQDMPLSGAVHAQTTELGLLSLYFPDIDRAAGELHADVNVAGTLGAPQLNGVVKVSGGELDLYQVNLGLRQVSLEAHLNDGGLDFSGNARAGAGTAAANGHLEWHNLLPYGKFHLEGANLRVADTPEAQIDASPNLAFAVDGRRIEVTGTVTVPYAKIQPKDITNAVRTSSDEVIVGQAAPGPMERFEVMSTITLTLGDKVSVDASGLTGRVTGSVTIRSGYDAITRATGELSVANGIYLAYARKLDIQRGRLIFTGGSIDDPGVDLRAQKEFPDVTAGVNVRGTLQQPRMSFFSDPPLPQSQIMSLILSGSAAQATQSASNAALGQGAALLAAQVGSRVGLPDVSLETDPLANETSLVLGRYLTPRLYVSYGVSLTETLNTLKMRYTLGDHWVVRTELGTARGADLVYSITK